MYFREVTRRYDIYVNKLTIAILKREKTIFKNQLLFLIS